MKKLYSEPKVNVYNIKNRTQFLTGSSGSENTREGQPGTDPDIKEALEDISIWD